MHQIAPEVWNRIADSQPLRTEWAQRMFPLPAEQMYAALAEAEVGARDKVLEAAYLAVMPLLWEAGAISRFLIQNPNLTYSIQPIETANEAVMLASKDFPLSKSQQKQLRQKLETAPT